MSVQPTGAAASSVPRWQAVIAALSLALLSVVVLFPLGATLLAFWGGVLGVASAWSLDAVGVRGQPALEGAVAVAVALLGSAAAIALAGAVGSGIRKLGVGREAATNAYGRPPISAPTPPKRWSSQLFDHPWLALGGMALFVDGCVVPFQASRAIQMSPEVLGGFITGQWPWASVLGWRLAPSRTMRLPLAG